ncbi:MAG TPA: uroporphyrinogen-III synthase [Pyrinomonadaceae bacterium]|nr:uroporphyrinogen-III synthase [Pyrinomonadaceae bacterium]
MSALRKRAPVLTPIRPMVSELSNQDLSHPTVLLSPNETTGELAAELQRQGLRVLAWPALDLGALTDYQALDEAIENLFGYDWVIFPTVSSVEFFVQRFLNRGHDISELDTLRVCTIGEEAVAKLGESQIHIDVIPDHPTNAAVFESLETYVGGREALHTLNFVIPVSANARNGLSQFLEDASARVDSVIAYRTVAANDSSLVQLNTLLAGGGVDCIVFRASTEMRDLAQVFGTSDLSNILAETTVVCADLSALRVAADFGLHADFTAADRNPRALAEAIYRYVSK